MAIGNYGTKRLVNVPINDIEILYTYAPNRSEPPVNDFTVLDNSILRLNQSSNGNVMDGFYNLRLPAEEFSNIGIYTIIVRPVEIITQITDCGVLAAFPDIKGVVLDTNQLNLTNGIDDLVGSRIEYYDGNVPTDNFTIITSANRVEPITQNLPSTTQKAVRYRFNNNSSLIFLTVTPSSAPTVKPNSLPFIGQVGQRIKIHKTSFDPIMMEVELTEYDINSLAVGLYGNQSKGIQDGIYTIYNFNNEIYKQYNLYEIQDQFTGEPLFEIREQRSNIDETKDFTTRTNDGTNSGV
jgi:hypothetical protein